VGPRDYFVVGIVRVGFVEELFGKVVGRITPRSSNGTVKVRQHAVEHRETDVSTFHQTTTDKLLIVIGVQLVALVVVGVFVRATDSLTLVVSNNMRLATDRTATIVGQGIHDALRMKPADMIEKTCVSVDGWKMVVGVS
jgi:vacuolar-type H+-ATPase subunit B/Vma2